MARSLRRPRIASSSMVGYPSVVLRRIAEIYRSDISNRHTAASSIVGSRRGRAPSAACARRKGNRTFGRWSGADAAGYTTRHSRAPRGATMPRVLLIGWDGADWRILDPLLEQGALPNL